MLSLSIINDNGTTIYTAKITFNVNNSIIIIEILKNNTSTITKPQELTQYIPLNIKYHYNYNYNYKNIINYKYIYNSYVKWFKFSDILDLVSDLI